MKRDRGNFVEYRQAARAWYITGASKQSGVSQKFTVMAHDEEEATRIANDRGIVVANATPIRTRVDEIDRTFDTGEITSKLVYFILGVIGCLIGILGYFATEKSDPVQAIASGSVGIIGAIFLLTGNVIDLRATLRYYARQATDRRSESPGSDAQPPASS